MARRISSGTRCVLALDERDVHVHVVGPFVAVARVVDDVVEARAGRRGVEVGDGVAAFGQVMMDFAAHSSSFWLHRGHSSRADMATGDVWCMCMRYSSNMTVRCCPVKSAWRTYAWMVSVSALPSRWQALVVDPHVLDDGGLVLVLTRHGLAHTRLPLQRRCVVQEVEDHAPLLRAVRLVARARASAARARSAGAS